MLKEQLLISLSQYFCYIMLNMIIWIASYPKSGNTWIRSIISLLLFSKDGIMQNFDLLNSIEQYPVRRHFLDLVKNYNDPIEIQKQWIPSQKIINQDKK